MLILEWQPDCGKSWEHQQGELLAFVQKYGRGKISDESYRQLMKLSRRDLLAPGSSLLLAYVRTEEGPLLAGISCITDAGRKISVVVVHPLYRNCGIGSSLLSRQLAKLGELSCRTAVENTASLQMCLRAGLCATRLSTRRGRALLEFTGGLASKTTGNEMAAHVLPKQGKEGD